MASCDFVIAMSQVIFTMLSRAQDLFIAYEIPSMLSALTCNTEQDNMSMANAHRVAYRRNEHACVLSARPVR